MFEETIQLLNQYSYVLNQYSYDSTKLGTLFSYKIV